MAGGHPCAQLAGVSFALILRLGKIAMNWQPIDTAPFGEDLQLSVIEDGEVHPLVFPCRRIDRGWLHGRTDKPVPIRPSHWRPWGEKS